VKRRGHGLRVIQSMLGMTDWDRAVDAERRRESRAFGVDHDRREMVTHLPHWSPDFEGFRQKVVAETWYMEDGRVIEFNTGEGIPWQT